MLASLKTDGEQTSTEGEAAGVDAAEFFGTLKVRRVWMSICGAVFSY